MSRAPKTRRRKSAKPSTKRNKNSSSLSQQVDPKDWFSKVEVWKVDEDGNRYRVK